MIQNYMTGIVLLIVISCLWLLVQRLWQRSFPEYTDADALANRSGCSGCNCGNKECKNPDSNPLDREAH